MSVCGTAWIPSCRHSHVCPELKWPHHGWNCRWTISELCVVFCPVICWFAEICTDLWATLERSRTDILSRSSTLTLQGNSCTTSGMWFAMSPTSYLIFFGGGGRGGEGINVLNKMEKHCPNLPTFEMIVFTLYACCFQGLFVILLSNF